MSNRNNESRMGANNIPSPQNDKPETKPGLLDFVSPTQFVDLPSKGRFYPESHPLHNKDSVEIRFMTAKDEDILSSESLLRKGIAVDRFLENVVIDKSFPVGSLLIGDKNAILISSRISGYGNIYDTEIVCPNCGHKNRVAFDLNGVNVHYGLDGQESDIQKLENGNYSVLLPVSKVTVEFKLLTSKDESKMIKKITNARKRKEQSSFITDQYKMMIVSAQGVTDSFQIARFVDLMPVGDSKVLKQAYRKTAPNVELKHDFTCISCTHEQELEVPFGADFFWPKS